MQAKKRRQGKDFFGPTVIKSVSRILAYLLDRLGGKKKLSAVTMASFTFSLLDFTKLLDDDSGFMSADKKKTDGRNLLATKSPQELRLKKFSPLDQWTATEIWRQIWAFYELMLTKYQPSTC